MSAAPGSYSILTFALTHSTNGSFVQSKLPNGSIYTEEKMYTERSGNREIIAFCQASQLVPPGSLAGWKLVGVFDSNGVMKWIYALNGKTAIDVSNAIGVDDSGDFGNAQTGRWVLAPNSSLTSGSLSISSIMVFSLGSEYTEQALVTIGYKIKNLGSSGSIWLPGSWRSSAIIGTVNDATGISTGSISGDAAIPLADLSSLFPGISTP